MWYPHTGKDMGAVQGWLLSVCYPFFDVRHRDGVPVSLGLYRAGYGGGRTVRNIIFPIYFDFGIGLRMAQKST